MNKVLEFCLVLLVSMSLSGILLSEASFIDFRYPTEIVDPRPVCIEKGFFPHPRNCSWFYRCHSAAHVDNYYRTDYFECAPGTVFNNELKVCTPGHWSECSPYECNSKCEPTVRDCSTFIFCNKQYLARTSEPLSIPELKTMELCSDAIYKCYNCPDILGDNVCPRGQLYSPNHPYSMGGSSPSRLISVRDSIVASQCLPPLADLTCPNKWHTDHSCKDCVLEINDCQTYGLCQPSNIGGEDLRLCKVAISHCFPCNSIRNYCKEGDLFDMNKNTCVKQPDDSMYCSASTTPSSVTTDKNPECIESSTCGKNYACTDNECICESPNIIEGSKCIKIQLMQDGETCSAATGNRNSCAKQKGTVIEISSLAKLQSYGLDCLTSTTNPCNVWVGVLSRINSGGSNRKWIFTDGGVTISNTNPSDSRWHVREPDAASQDNCIYWNTQCDGNGENCVTAIADGQSSTQVVILCRAFDP